MIRFVSALLLALAAAASTAEAADKTDRELAGLSGPVRKVTTEAVTYRVMSDGSHAEQRREPVETVSYSKSGILVERVTFAQGKPVAKATYQPAGEGAKLVFVDNPVDVGFGSRRTRLRPAASGAVALVRDDAGQYVFFATRAVSTAGRLLDETLYAGDKANDAAMLSRVRYRYNLKGQLEDISRMAGRPSAQVERTRVKLDSAGRIAEEQRFGLGNVPVGTSTFTYEADAQGNWVKQSETTVVAGVTYVIERTRTIEYGQ
jgi:hypothetical protein